MSKITKLTAEQKRKLEEYRERFFSMATSTEPGDKDRAAKAGLRLAEIAGLGNCTVEFVKTPQEGASISASLGASLRASIRYSLCDSLWDSLSDSFSDSLCESLWASLGGSIRASLWDSLWVSIWDSPWTALCSYCVEELGVECSDENREILKLYREIAETSSAIWIVPGKVVICEKPTNVTIVDGKLVDIKWGF